MNTTDQNSTSKSVSSTDILLVIIMFLVGVIIAIVAGWLVRSGGSPLPYAILSGGGALVTAVTLMLAIAKALGLLGRGQ